MKKILSIIFILVLVLSVFSSWEVFADEGQYISANLNSYTYKLNGVEAEITKYTAENFEQYNRDYLVGNLPSIYITDFLFDGVSIVKPYDLDDFTQNGNDYETSNLKLTVVNINNAGNYEFTGELKGGMIAVNTNGIKGNINIILNNVNIDTDSKKAPAIYVYNKDINYTDCKVTITTTSGSKNYIEGGKLKKVSLLPKGELNNYEDKYSGDNKTNFTNYNNYYGIYTGEELNKILFAKVQADSEDLADGDPYYYYKASGAISSDIDLYFEGSGYLEVKSKNKEGIETKGNLIFQGGTGDYVIYAEDDCLNTTTDYKESANARNDLIIDVNSLVAIVDSGENSSEGDAIDSNGKLTINGGTIIAVAHPGQDSGLDSEKGTYINGGTIIATGDMYDEVSSESSQKSIVLGFNGSQAENSLITLLDKSDKPVFSYKTDRKYSYLVYSSDELNDGNYYFYKDGNIEGTENYGFYSEITSYSKGIKLGYSLAGIGGGMRNMGMMENDRADNSNGKELNSEDKDNSNNQDMPTDMQNMTPPEKPSGDMPADMQNMTPPNGQFEKGGKNGENSNSKATNETFTVNGIVNAFSGVGVLDGQEIQSETNNMPNILLYCLIGAGIIIVIGAIIILVKKK